jgi:hypothetical protein
MITAQEGKLAPLVLGVCMGVDRVERRMRAWALAVEGGPADLVTADQATRLAKKLVVRNCS